MIVGTMMGAFAEGMALCQAADLPMDTLLQVTNHSPTHPLTFPLTHLHQLE